jgi:hypothetical protein
MHASTCVTENPIQFAFVIIVHGGKFTQLQQILAFCNILALSESACYRAQKLACERSSNSLKSHAGIGNERCTLGLSLPSTGAGVSEEMQNIMLLILLK